MKKQDVIDMMIHFTDKDDLKFVFIDNGKEVLCEISRINFNGTKLVLTPIRDEKNENSTYCSNGL